MSVGGGNCTNNSQCGSCAICENGTCRYLCNQGQICINGQCVYASNTSNAIVISGENQMCAGSTIDLSISATLSSLPYNGIVDIAVFNQSTRTYIISTTDNMTGGKASYQLMIPCPAPYGIFASIDRSNITDSMFVQVNNCSGGCISTCRGCGNSSSATTSSNSITNSKYFPLLLGGAIGMAGVIIIYEATK